MDRFGTALPDLPGRTSSALSAYAPLAKKVFGVIRIQRAVRLQLFFALVVSRLTYNVQTWSNITTNMYKKLNSVYMRGLRRIAARSKFDKQSAHEGGSDHHVRLELNAMSLQCVIIHKRLLLVAAVLRHGPPHLLTMLASYTDNADRAPLPWVRAVRNDLQRLWEFHRQKLEEIGPPDHAPQKWVDLMVNYPFQWKELVKSMRFTSMDMDSPKGPAPSELVLPSLHTCDTCAAAFVTSKALDAHCRARHKQRSALTKYIGSCLVCPVCFMVFST